MSALDHSVIVAALLVILSVVASKAASRFGIPALLVFLLLGVGAGPHGFSAVAFSDIGLAQKLGVFALIFILTSGGLGTELSAARKFTVTGLVLSTLGVIISTALIGLFAHAFLEFTYLEGFLLGSIVSSTDVAAVFTVLRSRDIHLKDGIRPLLELESALNDPMSVFLGVGLLSLLLPGETTLPGLVVIFFRQMLLGAAIGWGAGKAAAFLINRIDLEYDGLYPVLSIGCILLTYAITQAAGGSGFLAAYFAGIVLGNGKLAHRKSLLHFHDGIAWLMQIAMFLTMGLLIDPAALWSVAPYGVGLSVFLLLVARPASVLLSFPGRRFTFREKLMVSWGGLRGAVPIILATYPLTAGIPKANLIFNLVFFVVFFSVLIQGPTIPAMAKWLDADSPLKRKVRFPLEFTPTGDFRNQLLEIEVPTGSRAAGRSLLDLALPPGNLVVLIHRKNAVIVPRGTTQVEVNDILLVLAGESGHAGIRDLFS